MGEFSKMNTIMDGLCTCTGFGEERRGPSLQGHLGPSDLFEGS